MSDLSHPVCCALIAAIAWWQGGIVISFPAGVFSAELRLFCLTFIVCAVLVRSAVVTAQRVIDADKPNMGPAADPKT